MEVERRTVQVAACVCGPCDAWALFSSLGFAGLKEMSAMAKGLHGQLLEVNVDRQCQRFDCEKVMARHAMENGAEGPKSLWNPANLQMTWLTWYRT
jgi:hypothetical protein